MTETMRATLEKIARNEIIEGSSAGPTAAAWAVDQLAKLAAGEPVAPPPSSVACCLTNDAFKMIVSGRGEPGRPTKSVRGAPDPAVPATTAAPVTSRAESETLDPDEIFRSRRGKPGRSTKPARAPDPAVPPTTAPPVTSPAESETLDPDEIFRRRRHQGEIERIATVAGLSQRDRTKLLDEALTPQEAAEIVWAETGIAVAPYVRADSLRSRRSKA